MALPFRSHILQTIGAPACLASTLWPSTMMYLTGSVLGIENQRSPSLMCVWVGGGYPYGACTQSTGRWTHIPPVATQCDRSFKRGLYNWARKKKKKALKRLGSMEELQGRDPDLHLEGWRQVGQEEGCIPGRWTSPFKDVEEWKSIAGSVRSE